MSHPAGRVHRHQARLQRAHNLKTFMYFDIEKLSYDMQNILRDPFHDTLSQLNAMSRFGTFRDTVEYVLEAVWVGLLYSDGARGVRRSPTRLIAATRLLSDAPSSWWPVMDSMDLDSNAQQFQDRPDFFPAVLELGEKESCSAKVQQPVETGLY